MPRLTNHAFSVHVVIAAAIIAIGAVVIVLSMRGEPDLADENNSVSVGNAVEVSESREAAEHVEVAIPRTEAPHEDMQEDAKPALDKTIRVKYANSPNLPDGIAFAAILMLLTTMQDDSVVSRDWVIQEMGFGYTEAEAFRDRLIVVNEEFVKATARILEELLCSHGVPKVYGDDVFVTLEIFDDAKDAIAEDHYLNFASQLPQSQAQQLQEWIDDQKLHTVSTRHSYKELYQNHDVNGDAVIARLCLPPLGHAI